MITIRNQHVIEHDLNFPNRGVSLDVVASHADYADVLNRVTLVANKPIDGWRVIAVVDAFAHRVVESFATAQARLWRVGTEDFNDLDVIRQTAFLCAAHGALCQKCHPLRWITEILRNVPLVVVPACIGIPVSPLTRLNSVNVSQSVFTALSVQSLTIRLTEEPIFFANQFTVRFAVLLVISARFLFSSKGHSSSFSVVQLTAQGKMVVQRLFLALCRIDAIAESFYQPGSILPLRFFGLKGE